MHIFDTKQGQDYIAIISLKTSRSFQSINNQAKKSLCGAKKSIFAPEAAGNHASLLKLACQIV
jgi:hypothetical protein